MRQYHVHFISDGEFCNESSAIIISSENEAIDEFRKQVKESCDAILASTNSTPGEPGTATPLGREIEMIGEAMMTARTITHDNLIEMSVGDEFWLRVGKRRHFIRRLPDASETTPAQSASDLQEALLKAILEGDLARVRGILNEDYMERLDNDGLGLGLDLVRLGRADVVVDLIEHFRENCLRLPNELSEFERGERNGMIFAILLAARVPYTTVGEIRPSRIWQNMHEVVRLVVTDGGIDSAEFAHWILSQDMPESASPTQPDFAEQVRSTDVTKETLPVNPWFVNEAKSSIALDDETFDVEEQRSTSLTWGPWGDEGRPIS